MAAKSSAISFLVSTAEKDLFFLGRATEVAPATRADALQPPMWKVLAASDLDTSGATVVERRIQGTGLQQGHGAGEGDSCERRTDGKKKDNARDRTMPAGHARSVGAGRGHGHETCEG